MEKEHKNGQKIKSFSFRFLCFALGIIILISFYILDNSKIISYNGIANKLGIVNANDKYDFFVEYIDVSQGDCTLIYQDGHCALIDTGDAIYSDKLVRVLDNYDIDKLDFVILTHLHSDHASGIFDVIKNFCPEKIYVGECDFTKSEIDFKRLQDLADFNDFELITVCDTLELELNSAQFKINATLSDDDNLNNASLVTKVQYNNKSFLFTGDIENKAERFLCNKSIDLSCDVLKVSHHGSNTSSCDEFLAKCNPKVCIISCGYDNSFAHPADNTITRLNKYTQNVLRTDLLNDIKIHIENNNIVINNVY